MFGEIVLVNAFYFWITYFQIVIQNPLLINIELLVNTISLYLKTGYLFSYLSLLMAKNIFLDNIHNFPTIKTKGLWYFRRKDMQALSM